MKRVLSLDGGGVRGAVIIAFLEEIERQIAAIEGRKVRLCDWFDPIGGTSTGAIIVGGLALGYSAEGMPPGLFVDGGVTPFNNPSLMLFMVATLPQYGLNFEAGEDRLQIVSVGTGSFRERLTVKQARNTRAYAVALRALTTQITDAQQQVLALMSWIGHSPTPWIINSELGDLGAGPGPCALPFQFLRYDIRLEKDWLLSHLGQRLTDAGIAALREMDDPTMIPELYGLARLAAAQQVKPSDIKEWMPT